jgi:hypothetical protein
MLRNSIFHGREKSLGKWILFPEWAFLLVCLFLILDDLDGTFGTLHLACSTNETVLNVYCNRLFVLKFENTYWTNVNACSASSAFIQIDLDFNHQLINSAF